MNALSGLRYDLLQSTDIGGAFNRGMEMGTQMRERRDQRNALNLYATDPAGAINALMPVNPEMAMRLNDDYRAGEKTKREATFREAASGYIGGDGDAADAEFLRMVEIDPMAAMKIKSAKRDEAFDRLKSVDGAYDIAIQHLGSVTDEAGYQAVLGAVESRLQPLGLDIRSMVPPNYPGPDGVRQLLQSAMTAKEQLAALHRSDRLEADMEDDKADNARADRVADNLISTRTRNASTAERRATVSERRGSGGRGGASRPTATGPNGQKIQWNGRNWVDEKGAIVK
ncbi:MAG: hypothetical protein IT552_09725 [Sphingomonadaceae bacterium]|nr:hypothetical protein [Sphingomonadaceae bacterium]